jgi:hypothetical protein
MSLPTAPLLNLPRELRNQIYEYLRHEVTLDWRWDCTRTRRIPFRVRVPNAPRLSVLLVCSRLHEEILEEDFSKDMTVMLVWRGKRKKLHAPWCLTPPGSTRVLYKSRALFSWCRHGICDSNGTRFTTSWTS